MHDFTPPAVTCDVTVLAGDIHQGIQGVQWAQETFTGPILMVLGNHELYGHDWPGLLERCKKEAEGSNVTVLENDEQVFEEHKVIFMGATLWTDFELNGNKNRDMALAKQGMNDYNVIRQTGTGEALTPTQTEAAHRRSRTFLSSALLSNWKLFPEYKRVVITHHLPSHLSISARYQNDKLSPAFASSLKLFGIVESPSLWIHGHSHTKADYVLVTTRVLANPRGYPGERSGFNPKLVVAV